MFLCGHAFYTFKNVLCKIDARRLGHIEYECRIFTEGPPTLRRILQNAQNYEYSQDAKYKFECLHTQIFTEVLQKNTNFFITR